MHIYTNIHAHMLYVQIVAMTHTVILIHMVCGQIVMMLPTHTTARLVAMTSAHRLCSKLL